MVITNEPKFWFKSLKDLLQDYKQFLFKWRDFMALLELKCV